MTYKVIAGLRPWSGYYLDGQVIPNGNFTPAQLTELKKIGLTIVDSNEPPPTHLDLLPNPVRHLSPVELDDDWAKREAQMKGPDPMAMMPPPPKNPLDPEAVKAAAIAAKG